MRLKLLLLIIQLITVSAFGAPFTQISIEKNAHPAVKSAAKILAKKLNISPDNIIEKDIVSLPAENEIVLDYGTPSKEQQKFIGQDPEKVEYDGYLIKFEGNKALIFGKRPRSLLFASGDVHWWKDQTSGVYLRQPAFEHRNCNLRENDVAGLVSDLGVNTLLVSGMSKSEYVTLEEKFPELMQSLAPDVQERFRSNKEKAKRQGEKFAKLCHDADVDFYPFLYGNDMNRWSPEMTDAIYKAFPSVKGVRATSSWEKATLCPSDPKTWEIINAYIRECVGTMQGDGFFVTFWDWFGLYCQCDRCKASGMNKFDAQLEKCLGEYQKTMSSLGKPVIIRTWASGTGHWSFLEDGRGGKEMQWVHAPGYGGFCGTPDEVWGKVIKNLSPDVSMQVKVYYSDCFPDARYNPLIGQTGKHRCINEYQITGQTTGNFYFPAVNVRHTAWTMKKNYELTGKNGGVSLFWGATKQGRFNPFSDIANGINFFAWKELSWNPNADVEKIWQVWVENIYGKDAAPFVIKALKSSEWAADNTFSTLGFGSDTNSGFPGDIYTREVRLMYTNRYYLPEYRKFLEPTLENINLVKQQKEKVLLTIDSMKHQIEKAQNVLKPEYYAELKTRIQWMEDVAVAYRDFDVSYWRFRYLRYLYSMRTTDPTQMSEITKAYDNVMASSKTMFQYDPTLKFSCYDVPLGEVSKRGRLGLGSPVSIMRDIYSQSRGFVEDIVGPDYLPSDLIRIEAKRPMEQKEAKPNATKPEGEKPITTETE